MDSRSSWSQSRDRLINTLISQGYPAELGELIARHIGSPKGIERMISYLKCVRPDKAELIVDEMLAIKSDIDRWRSKKECERANIARNNVLNYGLDDDGDTED